MRTTRSTAIAAQILVAGIVWATLSLLLPAEAAGQPRAPADPPDAGSPEDGSPDGSDGDPVGREDDRREDGDREAGGAEASDAPPNLPGSDATRPRPVPPRVREPLPPSPVAPAPGDDAAPGEPPGVLLQLEIGADGRVRYVEVASVVPAGRESDALRDAAVAYGKSLRFEPARVEGRAVPASIRFEVRFAEAPDDPPPADPPEPTGSERADGPGDAEQPEPQATVPSEDVPSGAGTDQGAVAGMPDGAASEFEATGRVDAELRETPRAAASDHRIEVGQLGRVPRDDAQGLLTLAPGVVLTQHANRGHARSMYLRGFDAAEGEDVELLLEGVPLNSVSNAHGHGYADTLFVVPEAVQAVRFVQGPFDPAQGDFAIAGTAEYQLGLPQRGFHGELGVGSYGERQVTAWYGPPGMREGTLAAFHARSGSGFGPNRASSSAAAMAQYDGRLADHLFVRALLFGGAGEWDSAGVIREDDFLLRELPCDTDFESQFFCTHDSRQGGSTRTLGASVKLEWIEGTDRVELQFYGVDRWLRIRENFTGFTTDPRTDGGPQRGDLLDQRYDATTVGGRIGWTKRVSAFGAHHDLATGLTFRQDGANTVTDRLRAELSAPYRTDFDRRVGQTHLALFGRATVRLHERLHLIGGARLDGFGFDVVDRNRPSEDRLGERLPRQATSGFGWNLSPRGTVRVGILPQVDWLVSAGLGARSSDAAALSEGELAPFAEVVAAETGFVVDLVREPGEGSGPDYAFHGSLAAFFTRVEQDLVFDPSNGRNTTTGPSHRSGVAALARARWAGWLDAQVSGTYTRAHLPPRDAGVLDPFAGPRLPFLPEWVLRGDVAAHRSVELAGETWTGRGALGVQWLGARPLPLEQETDPFAVLDLAASLRWRWLELGLHVSNLFDTRYRDSELYYVSTFDGSQAPPSAVPQRHFSAGAPRQLLFTLGVHTDEPGASTE